MPVTVRRLDTPGDADLAALAGVLADCVEGGASVSFLQPLGRERALAFWRRVAASAAAGERVLLVAEDEGGICGTVQVILDLPENQPHRADVSKMLVHRRARRRGVGEALMRAAEAAARGHHALDVAQADLGVHVHVGPDVHGAAAHRLAHQPLRLHVGGQPQLPAQAPLVLDALARGGPRLVRPPGEPPERLVEGHQDCTALAELTKDTLGFSGVLDLDRQRDAFRRLVP